MKAAPLIVHWHEEQAPVYSAHFEPHGKGRLATGGGDHHVRIWKVETNGDERSITYLSTLMKHTQAVNVVRWCPRGELLASAGDDGNILLWVPADNATHRPAFGEDDSDDVEKWRVKTSMRSSNIEIYDLAWSPDGLFLITGSMDNVARIYSATNGSCVRQIAEHNHYVQGVAWDPLNEYVATQSSDRSVHIYTLKTKDGQFSLSQHNKVTKMDMPARRISSNSPAPPDFGGATNYRTALIQDVASHAVGSPVISAPGTPQSLALPMNPPPTSHSRRSSFSSQIAASIRRSVSPSPSMPLPAVMPSASPALSGVGYTTRNTHMYANETFTSFFRRLTFAPDGSLLFTPAGQYKAPNTSQDAGKKDDDIINTVYIYTRGGLNKPPVAHLPGHKKPSIAVKCSPIFYNMRLSATETKEITIDTGNDEEIDPLPEPAVPQKTSNSMDPPPISAPSPSQATMPSPRLGDLDHPAGPAPVFSLPYRIVYGVATQDTVYVYDTQQQKPLCVVSNLHHATFTDLCWSNDGQTLFMSSSDGFCSTIAFAPGELGSVYHPPAGSVRHTPTPISVAKANSATSTPQATPTMASPHPVPAIPRSLSNQSAVIAPPPNPPISPFATAARPASPARSMSTSSVGTQSSFAFPPDQNAQPMNNPTPSISSMPSIAAASANPPSVPLFTPPQTPGVSVTVGQGSMPAQIAGLKRLSNASEVSEDGREKKRRIAPTLISETLPPPAPPAPPSNKAT